MIALSNNDTPTYNLNPYVMLMILRLGTQGMKSTKSNYMIDKKEKITCARVTLGVDFPHNFILLPSSFINSLCVIRSLPLGWNQSSSMHTYKTTPQNEQLACKLCPFIHF